MQITEKKEWRPHAGPQENALLASEFEVLYGGARGGGKTEAGFAFLIADDYYKHPLYKALTLRKNSTDLEDWIDRARVFYAPLGGIVVGKPAIIKFPSGAKIRTGHIKDENAYTKYQGQEYHRQLFEELTQTPSEESYLKVVASCRSTVPELTPQIMGTTNPDGPGHEWVARRWGILKAIELGIIPENGIPLRPIRLTDPITNKTRIFIPAKVQDNPTLMQVDPSYFQFLKGLPDGLREQWLSGSWLDFDIKGAYYIKEMQQAKREGRIKPIGYNPDLKVHTVWDLASGVSSSADSMAIGFYQRTKDGQVNMLEYYENSGFGLQHYILYLQSRSYQAGYIYGKHFAPHDIKQGEFTTGMTRQQKAAEMGIDFEVVPKLNVADGIQMVRFVFPRLWLNDNGMNMTKSESEAPGYLRLIKNYRQDWDENKQIYTPYHDWTSHGADMTRYMATIESEMTNEDTGNSKSIQPPQSPLSEYEGTKDPRDDPSGKHPMLKGVDIAAMGHR